MVCLYLIFLPFFVEHYFSRYLLVINAGPEVLSHLIYRH